jgi:hypothetical protein
VADRAAVGPKEEDYACNEIHQFGSNCHHGLGTRLGAEYFKRDRARGQARPHHRCAVELRQTDAKGSGPAAAAMKSAPADLTQLAQENGGKYPSAHVASVIRGQATIPSHGSQDMPIWGPLFSSISQGHEGQVQQRTANLVQYIETLQAK